MNLWDFVVFCVWRGSFQKFWRNGVNECLLIFASWFGHNFENGEPSILSSAHYFFINTYGLHWSLSFVGQLKCSRPYQDRNIFWGKIWYTFNHDFFLQFLQIFHSFAQINLVFKVILVILSITHKDKLRTYGWLDAPIKFVIERKACKV